MTTVHKNNSVYYKRPKKSLSSVSKSFAFNMSPVSFRKRLINQKIPKIKNEVGFFGGINVSSIARSLKNEHLPEKLPNMYLDNDSIYDTQYQELVDSMLEKGNKSFQFEKFVELKESKRQGEPAEVKKFKVCGRFNIKTELRAKSLLPQTLARLKEKKPFKKVKFNVDGIPALAYQR